MPPQQAETRRADRIVRMASPLPVCKIGCLRRRRGSWQAPKNAPPPHKFPHNFKPVRQGRTSVAGQPQILQTRKQRAESVFGVGLADRAMGAEAQPWGLCNFPQIPIMGKQVHPTAEFSAEGLSISERGLADCGATDVRNHQTAAQVMRFYEPYPVALAGSSSLPDEPYIVIFVIPDAPTVLVQPSRTSVLCEGVQ